MPDLPSPCPHDRPRKKDTRVSAWQRGYGAAHRRRRAVLIERYPICQHCQQEWSSDMDHIDGDNQNNEESNLQLLCHSCHSAKTAREMK